MKNSTKLVFIAASLCGLGLSQAYADGAPVAGQPTAQQPEGRGKSLDEIKANHLKRIEKMQDRLEKMKTCVTNAQTKDALRDCHPKRENERRHDRD